MADLSLDDFIKQSNTKSRVSNLNGGQQRKRKFVQAPLPKTGGSQKRGQAFDARQKLSAKTAPKDARDKIIINKKNGKGDARNKIMFKQVQKGTFDARSLIQRHQKKVQGQRKEPGFTSQQIQGPLPPDLALTRTLANPNAKGKAQIQLTSSGLKVTRAVPTTQVSLSNNSLQVTRRNKAYGDMQPRSAPTNKDFVPIIQIRNDRYKQPGEPSSNPYYQDEPFVQSYQYGSHPSFAKPTPAFSNQRGYRDLDDPEYNSPSIAVPEIPKVRIQNVRPVEAAGMRPVSYSAPHQQQSRPPPGAATVSQGFRVTQGGVRPGGESAALPVQAGVKRRQLAQSAPPPAQEVSGPLRLGKGGGPGIELRSLDTQHQPLIKKPKFSAAMGEEASHEEDDGTDYISPLQGFRVIVTNLFTGVTQDDIIELFGAVGPLKKAKLLKSGTAEVVYVNKKDAVSAVQKYHSRELDGQPMYVKMTTPVAAVVKKVEDHDPDITGEALRLYKKGTGIGSLPEAPIEIPTILRALFKAGPPGPNKSVKFTVKI
ncbi:polymerase delta-interacting protein 3-like [Elysia marginata]|uniref:Polymerase delta-interacting protein 3-like n=1 Tax=Elysia marginata TaxID=1093978 RepID=A0AAV4GJC7_9GAST|nr:polymerase delta-interacting protein 3-like [Elysia marginata]